MSFLIPIWVIFSAPIWALYFSNFSFCPRICTFIFFFRGTISPKIEDFFFRPVLRTFWSLFGHFFDFFLVFLIFLSRVWHIFMKIFVFAQYSRTKSSVFSTFLTPFFQKNFNHFSYRKIIFRQKFSHPNNTIKKFQMSFLPRS